MTKGGRTARQGASVRALPALIFGLLALAACSHPLDISDAEWANMTPQQRAIAERKQAQLDAEAERRAQPNYQQAERLIEIEEAARLHRVAERRQRGRLGDLIQCVVESGVARYPSGWRPTAEVGVQLARGEVRMVTLPRLHGDALTAVWAAYDESGMTLRLCRSLPRLAPPGDCAVMAATFRDLSQGMTWTVNLPGRLHAPVRCAFPPGPPVQRLTLDR